MEQEEKNDKSVGPDKATSPMVERDPNPSRSLETDTAATSLPSEEPHSDTMVKSESESDSGLFQAAGTGASIAICAPLEKLTLSSGSKPLLSGNQTTDKNPKESQLESIDCISERDQTHDSQGDRRRKAQPDCDEKDGTPVEKSDEPPEERQTHRVEDSDATDGAESDRNLQTRPEFDELSGTPFEKSEVPPDELVERLWRVKGVSCFGIGVLCKRSPLVIYCNPTLKNNAKKEFERIHDKFKRFMVVIWQCMLIRGTGDPKFSGKDTLGLASLKSTDPPPYVSAIGLPVLVKGRSALLGTFHCLVGMLLNRLAILGCTEPDPAKKQTFKEEQLKLLKESMEYNGVGLQQHLEQRKTKVKKKQQKLIEKQQATVDLADPSPSSDSSKYKKELEFLQLLLGADKLDLSFHNLEMHVIILCSPKAPFQVYSASNGEYQRQVGIEAVGGVPMPPEKKLTSTAEVAVYFTQDKDSIADVSHPQSLHQPSEIVEETEDLEPQTSVVWKRGPISGETTGRIVYTNMTYAVLTKHMRQIPLHGAFVIKHFVESDQFSVTGDSSSVVYLVKDKKQPKLLGAISAGDSAHGKDEWLWTYDDGREDGDIERTNKTGALVRTKGVSIVLPFHNQFKAVEDLLHCDIALRS